MASPWKNNAAAQAALRALGMDPGPLKGATHRYRLARGRERAAQAGVEVSTSQLRGHARKAKGERGLGDLLGTRRLHRGPQPTRKAAEKLRKARKGRKVVRTPAGDIVQPGAPDRTRLRELQRAAREGLKVAARVTVRMPNGAYRTRWVDGRRYTYSLIDREVVGLELVISDGAGIAGDFVLQEVEEGGWGGYLATMAAGGMF